MKVKYSLIPFIPATLVMLFFKLMSIFGVDGNGLFLGMNSMNITYTVIGISLGLFLVCIIINIFYRKTAPVYPVRQNYAAGVLAAVSGIAIAASSVAALIALWPERESSEYFLMTLICAIFSVPAGAAMILISRVHFQGKSTVSSLSTVYIFPALWGCAQLVSEFLQATKASIQARDLTALFCYIFIALYLFSNAMVVSRIRGRNPVKGIFIYGLPMAALCVTYGAFEFARLSREGFELSAVLNAVMMLALSAYAVSFVAELFANSYTKDELEIIDGLPKDDDDGDDDYVTTTDYDDLVFSNRPSDENLGVEFADDYFSSANGLDEFIFGYKYDEDRQPVAEDRDDMQTVADYEEQPDEDAVSEPAPAAPVPVVQEEPAQQKKKEKRSRKEERAEKKAEKERLAAEQKKAEEERRAAEAAQRAEDAKMAMAAAQKAENARRAEEAMRRQSDEVRRANEAARKASEERRAAEEAKRMSELNAATQAAKRAEEQRREIENAKLYEELQRRADEARLAEEQRPLRQNEPRTHAVRQRQ